MPETLFNKVAALRPQTLLKKSLWHRRFLVNFAKFLRTRFFYRTPPVAANKRTRYGILNSFMAEAVIIYRANQWTGFYIITASVMKELKASRKTLEQRQWSIWGIFIITVNRFHTLFQYSGFIYHFEDVLFHGAVYCRTVRLVPKNSKITK